MERLESKIDKICDAVSDVRVSIGKLEKVPNKIEEHDKSISKLESKTKVYDALATRKSVILANSIAIAALIVSSFPWLFKVIQKLQN